MTTTKQKIIEYIEINGQASGKELTDYIGEISSRAIRKQLKNLLEEGTLRKIGKPPKVYYMLAEKQKNTHKIMIDEKTRNLIDQHYLYISPSGSPEYGWVGFVSWCNKTNQNPEKTAQEYTKTLKKYDMLRKDGLIDGLPKMKQTFDKVLLDKLYYIDFYSIERFGKTKLGQMLLYAKQSQNKQIIHQLADEIAPQIRTVILKHAIDGILFIPPTVKREIQFMKELEKRLSLPISTLSVTKVKTEIIVPQKTLSKLADRVENAHRTIIVDETKKYTNILLIDDAVGSGSTLNETARHIRQKGLCAGSIVGLAITGSFKGFDVISEV
jgi:hypoxanthine-guanine phosphoribosyltransferase/biotin operon repressor